MPARAAKTMIAIAGQRQRRMKSLALRVIHVNSSFVSGLLHHKQKIAETDNFPVSAIFGCGLLLPYFE